MAFFGDMDRRVKRFGVLEIKLVQGAAMFVALIIVKLLPQILSLNVWWFVALAVVCGIRPVQVAFAKP